MDLKIQLTPTELQTQANEMLNLKEEFVSLFSGVSSELKTINSNWSPNLANNFLGKITSAQQTFRQVTDMLENGAKVANTCAVSFASVDSELSKIFNGGNKNTSSIQGSNSYQDNVSNEYGESVSSVLNGKKKPKMTFWDDIKKACLGTVDCVVSNTKKVVSKVKKSYEEKGLAYDIWQYGKCAIKVGKGIVKIVGSVGAIASGVGIPIAICGIISAGNDIVNGFTDAAYIYTDQYDKVGTTNYLKDLLVDSGGDLGEIIGNRGIGETFGKFLYTGLDLVSLLNGVDKMLKSLGKVNTVFTGSTGYSSILGETDFDDIYNNKIKFDLEADYFIRKLLKVNPSSDGNIVYEGIKSIYSVLKKAKGFGDSLFN